MQETLSIQEEIQEVVRLKDDKGKTHREIASILGLSERTARRRYAARNLQEAVNELVEESLDDFPDLDDLNVEVTSHLLPDNKGPIERFQPLELFGDAMVTCDYHIPLHDPVLINAMINCARAEGITNQLIIAGDLFHMEEFSNFLPYQPEASIAQEKYDGNFVVKTLLQTFDNIVISWGNHDFRLVKKLGYKKSFQECMQWMLSELDEDEFSRITFTELDYMYYYPSEDYEGSLGQDRQYRICHPRNFSSIPLTVPRKLAIKHGCSIMTAHSHHAAIGAAANGYDIVIEGGGFFDKSRTEYIQKTTANHEWTQGWTYFKDGVPTLISPLLGNHTPYLGGE